MDQAFQLQQQIQKLQQEVNDISQVCTQLQHSEQANALQLQQMSQKEMVASQGLRRIQQVAGQLSQDINVISSMAQQITSQALPIQKSLQNTGITGQAGAYGGQIGTFGHANTLQPGFSQAYNPTIAGIPTLFGNLSGLQNQGSQGYIANQFSTGGQTIPSAQSFSSPMTTNFGILQGTGQNLSGLNSHLGQSTVANAMNQLGVGSAAGQQSSMSSFGVAGSAASHPGSSLYSGSSQANNNLFGYTPYQTNLSGLR